MRVGGVFFVCSPTPSRRCGPPGAPPLPPALPTLAQGRWLLIQRVELLARTFVARARTLLAFRAAALRALCPAKEQWRGSRAGCYPRAHVCTVQHLRRLTTKFFFLGSLRAARSIRISVQGGGWRANERSAPRATLYICMIYL